MSCCCDGPRAPGALRIPAGLTRIPRQIGGFPEFRRALLAAIREHPPLDAWRARDEGDLGVMLLEMWAYLADSLAFYDEVIAHEAYLRTARLRPSVRRLAALLGYVPRPAVASRVALAAVVEGRRSLVLPAGLRFMSSGSGDEPPQTFELDADTAVHGLASRWRIDPQPPATAGALPGWTAAGLLSVAIAGAPRVRAGSPVLVRAGSGGTAYVRRVVARAPLQGPRGPALRLTFDRAVPIPASTPLADIVVAAPALTAGLWTRESVGSDPAAIVASSPARLLLDGVHRQIRPGTDVVVSRGDDHRWFTVQEASDVTVHYTAGGQITATNEDGDTVTVSAPPVLVPVTRLTLDAGLNAPSRKTPGGEEWATSHAATITVHHTFVPLGEVTAEPAEELQATASLALSAPVRGARLEVPDPAPTRFLLRDLDGNGLEVEGNIADAGTIAFTGDAATGRVLRAPVEVFGNVLHATRGETVEDELLGHGNASVPNQSFTLAKAPLTYVAAAAGDGSGVASTLRIRVDGVLWREVPSFYGAGPDDAVYVVRQDDDGRSVVTFGDGRRGRRLPTGAPVVATYRYGAGAAAPPAGKVTQILEPVDGLASVTNPLPAYGGADAESLEGIRRHAPRSALLLGRAVSLADFEAAAAAQPGVRAARALWRWHGRRQRPVAWILYIGDPGLRSTVGRAVRRIAEPSAPIEVERAEPAPLRLAVDLEVHPAYRHDDVLASAREALLGPDGFLAPERLGIGGPLIRSALVERLARVEGVLGVHAILADGAPFTALALRPAEHEYLDVEAGGLELNVWEGNGG